MEIQISNALAQALYAYDAARAAERETRHEWECMAQAPQDARMWFWDAYTTAQARGFWAFDHVERLCTAEGWHVYAILAIFDGLAWDRAYPIRMAPA